MEPQQALVQAKQQIIEKLKAANNILVTVSNNPSVDQLAACIGTTLFLNKLSKHATAVFSGEVPNTLEFLQPEKTIEKNTDSLRDFIISLDKSKADKLRYKVEDRFVRIYITPYRTSLTEKDLEFSEGEFNVEVVLALGVRSRPELDAAIVQHGRILHDSTVISVNAGQSKAPDIGQINWQETAASSLCEMLVSISEAFGTGLIDNQMATAFLTGIVAETDRFSNHKTSPKVMTMSAQLMAAGANQQLIVSKLHPPQSPPESAKPVSPPDSPPKHSPTGTLNIQHDEGNGELEVNPSKIHIDEKGNIVSKPPSAISHGYLASRSDVPPFTADTQAASYDTDNATPIDPLSENFQSSGKVIEPPDAAPIPSSSKRTINPPSVGPPTPVGLSSDTSVFPEPQSPIMPPPSPEVDNARNAVQQAMGVVPNRIVEPPAPAVVNPPPPEADTKPKEPTLTLPIDPKPVAQPRPPEPPKTEQKPSPEPLPQSASLAVPYVPEEKPKPPKPSHSKHSKAHKDSSHPPNEGLAVPYMPSGASEDDSSKDDDTNSEDRPAPPPIPPPITGLAVPVHAKAGQGYTRSK